MLLPILGVPLDTATVSKLRLTALHGVLSALPVFVTNQTVTAKSKDGLVRVPAIFPEPDCRQPFACRHFRVAIASGPEVQCPPFLSGCAHLMLGMFDDQFQVGHEAVERGAELPQVLVLFSNFVGVGFQRHAMLLRGGVDLFSQIPQTPVKVLVAKLGLCFKHRPLLPCLRHENGEGGYVVRELQQPSFESRYLGIYGAIVILSGAESLA
jgi:hypothetical protein